MSFNINQNIRVLVIGDIMIDHYIFGNCDRISPEAPVPIVEITSETYTLGGAGNVLKNLNAFNCNAFILAVTGDDDNALIATNHVAEQGFDDTGLIKDSARCTTVKSRVLAVNYQLIRLDRENTQPITENIANTLLAILRKNINSYDVVLVSDYNKGLLTQYFLKQIFTICRAANVKTILDPKGRNFEKYKGVNIIKPNKKEAAIATGITIDSRSSLEAACKKLNEITGCDEVIITMSAEGIAYYSNKELNVIPTKAQAIIDVTGAGDTVLAALGVALASGNTMYNACSFANYAAAVVVNKVGSATATLQEINNNL